MPSSSLVYFNKFQFHVDVHLYAHYTEIGSKACVRIPTYWISNPITLIIFSILTVCIFGNLYFLSHS